MNKKVLFKELETDKNIQWAQLLRTGHFKYGYYGDFKITADILRKLKENFDSDVRRVKIAVDYFHLSGEEAAGWIEQIELRDNDETLWIKVDWTKTAEEKIRDKEVRYLSADIDFAYIDIESGAQHGPVLMGAGLTNRPYIKDMKAILAEGGQEQGKYYILDQNQKKENEMPKFEEIMGAVPSLSDDEKAQLIQKLGGNKEVKASEEDKKKLSDAEKKAKEAADAKAEAEKKLSDSQAENKTLSERVQKLEEANKVAEKTATFNEMLSKGKVVESQREPFLSGDMAKFAENSVRVNLSDNGSGGGNGEQGEVDADKAQEEIDKKAKAKLSEDKNLDYGEAVSIVLSENPDLAKKYESR